MDYAYDVFISYSTDPDYRLAKELQTFLGGFHTIVHSDATPLRPLRVFVDESDLIQPGPDNAAGRSAITDLLERRLSESALLLVLCSRNARQSRWVNEEVASLLSQRGVNAIRIALTEHAAATLDDVVPASLLAAGITDQPYYDLRAFELGQAPRISGVRDFDEQRIALAAYLHGLSPGVLTPLWQREAAERQRQIEAALAGALRGQGRAAAERQDPQRAAPYFAAALERHESGGVRTDLLRSLQRVWRYDCIGGQHQTVSTSVLSWSADGSLIVGGTSRAIHVWNPEQRKSIATLRGMLRARFSPIARLLLSWGGRVRGAQVWDPRRDAEPIRFGEALGEATASWSPNGQRVAVWSPGQLHVFGTDGRTVSVMSDFTRDTFADTRWSRSGRSLACCENGVLQVWRVEDGTLESVRQDVHEYSWAGDTLVIAERERIVLSQANETVIALPPGLSVIEAKLSTSGRFVAATLSHGRFGLLQVGSDRWNLYESRETPRLTWAPSADRLAAETDGGALNLFTASESGAFEVRELETFESDERRGPASLAWSPDGKYIAAAARGRRVGVWDSVSGERATMFDADLLAGVPIAWRPDGRALAAGSLHGELQVWTAVDDWKPRRVPPNTQAKTELGSMWRPRDVRSPNGQFIVVRDPPNGLLIQRVDSGDEMGRVSDVGIADGGISWAPTSEWLAIEGDAVIQTVQRTPSGFVPAWSFTAGDRIDRFVWSGSGTRLAIGLQDATLMVIDLERGRLVNFARPMSSLIALAWAPDGSHVAASTAKHEVCLFDAATGDLLLELPDNPPGEEATSVTTITPQSSVLSLSSGVLTVADAENQIATWDLGSVLGPAVALSQRIEALTRVVVIDGEALDARMLFARGFAALRQGNRAEGWACCERALALAPHSRRFVALCGVAKAALEGLDAGRPLLAQAWESDRSYFTYLWLRAVGIDEPLPYDTPFWHAMDDHLQGRIDDRELWQQVRDTDNESRVMAGVAIGRRQDLAGETDKARRSYIRCLGMRIERIDELWVKLRLLQIDHGQRGRLTNWIIIGSSR